MPYLTTHEVANDLGVPRELISKIAGRIAPPVGRYESKKGQKVDPRYRPSMYTMYQHQVIGRTLELAPGSTINEKFQNIMDGYKLTLEEKEMIYQSLTAQQQMLTLSQRVEGIWESLKDRVGVTRVSRKLTELPVEYANLTPEECRNKAYESRNINPESAYLLAVKRDDQAAIEHVLSKIDQEPGTKISGTEIVNMVARFNSALGEEFRPKKHSWRRFRSKLLGTGRFKEKVGTGYLIVTEQSAAA